MAARCIRTGRSLAASILGFRGRRRIIRASGSASADRRNLRKSGTVQDYLDQQGVQPLFDVADRYGALYAKMLALLERLDSNEIDRRKERRDAVDMLPAGTLASLWLDIDAVDTLSAEP